MLKQARLYIKGDVIGVGFRAWTKIQAKLNKITGWVKNKHDHHRFENGEGVEVVIQGQQEQVEKMIELIKVGPPVSRVEDVEVIWQEPKEIFEEFEIRK